MSKNDVAPAVMGRPPKNMCKTCKGWGNKYKATFAIEYHGTGEEAKREQVSPLLEIKCKACKGSGIKGGVLRTESAPVLDMLKIDQDLSPIPASGVASGTDEEREEFGL